MCKTLKELYDCLLTVDSREWWRLNGVLQSLQSLQSSVALQRHSLQFRLSKKDIWSRDMKAWARTLVLMAWATINSWTERCLVSWWWYYWPEPWGVSDASYYANADCLVSSPCQDNKQRHNLFSFESRENKGGDKKMVSAVSVMGDVCFRGISTELYQTDRDSKL